MIEEIRECLRRDGLLKNGKIGVNYLSEKPLHYTIEAVPCDPTIKRYVDGGSLRQCLFVIASREEFSCEVAENLAIARFYEDLADEFEGRVTEKQLPQFKDPALTPYRFEVLSNGYLLSNDERTARFQIQARLIYRRDQIFH